MAKKTNGQDVTIMYGIVTNEVLVEVRGYQLPKWAYKIDPKKGSVTFRRVAFLLFRIYRMLPERPTTGPKGMSFTPPSIRKSREEFARRIGAIKPHE